MQDTSIASCHLRSLPVALALLLFAAAPARAQIATSGAFLDVCNKGTVPVEVVVARKNDLMQAYYEVEGTNVAPQHCERAYYNSFAEPAYLAFGLADSKGEWSSGKIAQVPDFGTGYAFFHPYSVLTASAKNICARTDETHYVIENDLQTDCATFKPAPMTIGLRLVGGVNVGHGPFLSLTSALYFAPVGESCHIVNNGQQFCNGGAYYLNISPSAADRELQAATGTSSGADVAKDPQLGAAQMLQALAKAAREEQEREARAAADAAQAQQRHLVERAADREKQQQQILAADAAGNPDVKVEAQMIRREAEDNRQRLAGTRQSPAAFDAQWMGHNVAIVGTVSRVEIDSGSSPQWVSIYFKESPGATFVVCSPYPDLFQERIGANLSALVGKTLEAAGQVESPNCGQKATQGSIRVVESKQWQVH